MFRRQRSGPTREISSVALAFHGRLAGILAPTRDAAAPPEPTESRERLAGPATVGLRDRIDRIDRRFGA